jgi:hypothetical protein
MNIRLEEDLAEGMRAYAGRLRLTGDVLGAAARRHRRRRAVRRSAYAAGVVALAGALAAGLSASNAAPPGRSTDAAPPDPSADAWRGTPRMMTVAEVSTQINTALADAEHMIEYVVIRGRHPAISFDDEVWFDPTTGAVRRHAEASAGKPMLDSWSTRDGDRSTTVLVDRVRRVWWTYTREIPEGKEFHGRSPTTPDKVRAALARRGSRLTLVGPEQIDGLATLHLRMTVDGARGTDDLWVDATTYRVVRRVIVKQDPGGDLRIQEDFRWLERTPEALAAMTFTPPAGFTEIPAPVPGSPNVQPSN